MTKRPSIILIFAAFCFSPEIIPVCAAPPSVDSVDRLKRLHLPSTYPTFTTSIGLEFEAAEIDPFKHVIRNSDQARDFRIGQSEGLSRFATQHVGSLVGAPVSTDDALRFLLDGTDQERDKLNLESVIISQVALRPALLICLDKLSDPVPKYWATDVGSSLKYIQRALSSTGFISCPDNPGDKPGTCFVVGSGLVLTNRHIAQSFADYPSAGGSGTFLVDSINKKPFVPVIDFARFQKTCNSKSTNFKVVEVLHVEKESGPDVALLRVELRDSLGNTLPPRLPLAGIDEQKTMTTPLAGRPVFLAGFPFADWREDFKVQRDIYGNVFGVKRLSPGTLDEASKSDVALAHNCSTLGGNSGSPLVDMKSGKVIGLHFKGRQESGPSENWAVPTWVVLGLAGVRRHILDHSGSAEVQGPDSDPEPIRNGSVAPAKNLDGRTQTSEAPLKLPLTTDSHDSGEPRRPTQRSEVSSNSSRREESASATVKMVAFDENGDLVSPNAVTKLVNNISNPPTDIFIMSHGWNNSAVDAERSYASMVAEMGQVADKYAVRPEAFSPLVVGIRWPSKSWVDDRPSTSSNEGATVDSTGSTVALRAANILAAIYENLPRNRSSDAQYSRDVMKLSEILATSSTHSDDLSEAMAIFRRYALPSDSSEEGNVFAGEPAEQPKFTSNEGSFSVFDAFRVFTYWQMKARAGIVGRNGSQRLIDALQRRFPSARVHVFGHSFGAKVVLSAITERSLPRPINTVVLLQPAISFWAFADNVPGTNRPGGYRSALDLERVSGPIVVTFSQYDTALTLWYPLASRVAGQVGEQFESAPEPNKYSALGAVGAYRAGSMLLDMHETGKAYSDGDAISRGLWSVNAGVSKDFIGGHSDIYKAPVAWLLWSAIRISFE